MASLLFESEKFVNSNPAYNCTFFLIQEHLAKHAGDKPYKCEVCPKQFNHKTDLRRHMCLHTGEKPFSCDVCGQLFKHLRCLESHRRRIHSRSKTSGLKKGFEPETLLAVADDDDGIELRKVVVTGSHIGPRPKA